MLSQTNPTSLDYITDRSLQYPHFLLIFVAPLFVHIVVLLTCYVYMLIYRSELGAMVGNHYGSINWLGWNSIIILIGPISTWNIRHKFHAMPFYIWEIEKELVRENKNSIWSNKISLQTLKFEISESPHMSKIN